MSSSTIAPSASVIARAKALASGQITPSLSGGFYPLPNPQQTHPENTTVFVGGLPGSVGREELEAIFRPFGEVTYVNIPPGKSCGFISFDNRSSAEWAIEQLQGFWLHGAQLRLAWGRLQGEKARQQQQPLQSPQNDLAGSIKQDMPFFSELLGLSADQRVKLGLYLEFAAAGNLGRLKNIMASKLPSSPPPASYPLIQRPKSPCACAPLPASRHDPYQSHGELCRHYDRLVSDLADSPPTPRSSGRSDTSPAESSTPPLSFTSVSAPTDALPSYPISPRLSGSSGQRTSSASGEFDALVHTFRPWKPSADHRHSENCITPMSLQQLEKAQVGLTDPVERLGWGMGSMGLNVGAGEWVPKIPSQPRAGFVGKW